MRFRLEIFNAGDGSIDLPANIYWEQEGVIKVGDASGQLLPSIYNCVHGHQVGSGGALPMRALKPGQAIALTPEINIATEYRLVVPDVYRVRFESHAWSQTMPDSEMLEIAVAPGSPSALDEVVGSLLAVKPREWCIQVTKQGLVQPTGRLEQEGIFVRLRSQWRDPYACLWITEGPAELTGSAAQRAASEFLGLWKGRSVYLELGRFQMGEGYMPGWNAFEQWQRGGWPNVKAKIIKALGVRRVR